MKPLIIDFSPTSCYFLLGSCILLSSLFSNTLTLCCSLNAIDQISDTCRTRVKIIVLYILIFTFLERKWYHNRFYFLYFVITFDTSDFREGYEVLHSCENLHFAIGT